LVLSHKHPDDYKYIAATLDDIRRTHKPLSTRHRIITVQGQTRDIVIIGERLHDDDTGEVIGTQGFYLDVTPTNEERQESISQALIEIAANRAAIEQQKAWGLRFKALFFNVTPLIVAIAYKSLTHPD
jgi:hypothetical protein